MSVHIMTNYNAVVNGLDGSTYCHRGSLGSILM